MFVTLEGLTSEHTIYYMHGALGHLPCRCRRSPPPAKVSVSRWVADRVAKSVETSWPPELLALAGSFPDFPDAAELRRGYGDDVRRESLD